MICDGMLSGPLSFGANYYYTGLGEYLAALIVGVPISFILFYVIYRVYTTKGTLKEVIIFFLFVAIFQLFQIYVLNNVF